MKVGGRRSVDAGGPIALVGSFKSRQRVVSSGRTIACESGGMKLPHPHLVILRSTATLVLSCLIGQAGWAAAFLGDAGDYFLHHRIGAWVTLSVSILGALVFVVLHRSAGIVNVALAAAVGIGVTAQVLLGEAGAASAHIFLGILLVALGTALTSWTYRHRLTGDVTV